MIDSIHARLIHWSETVKGNIGCGHLSSSLGLVASGMPAARQGAVSVEFDTLAYETEKAVQKLPEALKIIVIEFYVNDTNTIEQKLKSLGMSKRTLYRRLDNAQSLIQAYLK